MKSHQPGEFETHAWAWYRTRQGKRVQVDVGILPVVRWLDRLPGVTTQWSCQGDPQSEFPCNQMPHVIFFCHSNRSLKTIAKILEPEKDIGVRFNYASLQVDVCYGVLRYELLFANCEKLQHFLQRYELLFPKATK